MIFEDSSYQRPHTSFHYYPEDEDPELGCTHYAGTDPYSADPHFVDWSVPEDPQPLKLVKKHGYGYRSKWKEVLIAMKMGVEEKEEVAEEEVFGGDGDDYDDDFHDDGGGDVMTTMMMMMMKMTTR